MSGSGTDIHVSCVATLPEHFQLEKRPVKVHEPFQMLGLVEDDLRQGSTNAPATASTFCFFAALISVRKRLRSAPFLRFVSFGSRTTSRCAIGSTGIPREDLQAHLWLFGAILRIVHRSRDRRDHPVQCSAVGMDPAFLEEQVR